MTSKTKRRIQPIHIPGSAPASNPKPMRSNVSVLYRDFQKELWDDDAGMANYFTKRARETGYEPVNPAPHEGSEDELDSPVARKKAKKPTKKPAVVKARIIPDVGEKPVLARLLTHGSDAAPVLARVLNQAPIAAKVVGERSAGPKIADRPDAAATAIMATIAEPAPITHARIVEKGNKCSGTEVDGQPCQLQHAPESLYCEKHKYSGVVVTEKCRYEGCPRMTSVTYYCPEHLAEVYQVAIKPSTLPGAGNGLFTLKHRVRGELIAPYTGDILVLEDPSKDDDFGDDYALEIKKRPKTIISARRSNTGPGRYANARHRGSGQGDNNAQLTYNSRKKEGAVRASKAIQAGEEVTVAYGANYWKGRVKNPDPEPEPRPAAAAADENPRGILTELFDWLEPKMDGLADQTRLAIYRERLV